MHTRQITPDVRDVYERAGLWANRPWYSHVDEFAALTPDKVASVDSRRALSYSELAAASRNLAARLLELGVGPSDAVAVQLPNSVLLAVAHLAISRVQATFVPIHEAWREAEVRHLLTRAGARALIVVDRYKGFDHVTMIERIRSEVPTLEHVLVADWSTEGEDALWMGDVASDDPRLESIVPDADAPRHAMISSGTTALPKISEWSDNGLYAANAVNYADAVQLTSDDVVVGIATASTGATGYVFGVLAPLYAGATSVLVEPWEPDLAIRALERHRGTVAVAVPAQIIKMLEHPEVKAADFAPLRAFSNGGAPLPESRAREVEDVFGCVVQTMYGSTDAGTPTMMRVTDPVEKRVTTVGPVVEGAELVIVQDDGARCGVGEPGEVCWRSAQKTLGYMNDDDATRAAFDDDGWYRSGDIGTLDAEGYLRIVGRKKDMILRGGQNIFPGEIEEILARHPAIAAVAVAAMHDPVMGERACAFVVLADRATGFTFDEMVAHVAAAGVAKFKRPERLIILDELPLTAGGKVLKSALTELADATA